MSLLGRSLLVPVIASYADMIMAEARRRNWPVLSYKDFVSWVRGFEGESQVWAVLDRVFPLDEVPGRTVFIDLHRPWPRDGDGLAGAWLRPEASGCPPPFEPGARVTLLDDAAYTGNTARAAMEMIRSLGGTTSRVITCAARTAFIRGCAEQGISAACLHTARDGQDILHLRDFFPWLPFSGRRIKSRPYFTCPDGSRLACRLAPATFRGEDWLHLGGDERWRRRILDGARACVAALDAHLGRPSRVADLPLLGGEVAIPFSTPEQLIDGNTPLSALL